MVSIETDVRTSGQDYAAQRDPFESSIIAATRLALFGQSCESRKHAVCNRVGRHGRVSGRRVIAHMERTDFEVDV